MDEELRFHIESYAADLRRSGLSPEEARRRALAEFGGVEARKDDCREARGLRLFDEAVADGRYALRQLRASPVFAAVAIISLALGIGANTAIFSLMEQALWKPMPLAAPEQLRLFTWVSGPRPVRNSEWGSWSHRATAGTRASTSFSYAIFQALQQQRAPAFASVFAFRPIDRVTAIIDGQAELVSGELVSGNFYDGLAVVPIAGRAIGPADDTIGRGDVVAIISDGFWARRFGRDGSVIGKQIRINQAPVTIVGVNPPGFTGVEPGRGPDIFMPLTSQPVVAPRRYGPSPSLLNNPDYWWVAVMGRLGAGVSEPHAQRAMDLVLQQTVRATLPDRADRDQPQVRLLGGSRGLDNLREEFGRPLLVLFVLVALVLLIACANVANLLLARAASRRRELSLRLALGAGRWRITRQLLTEGLTLGISGGLLGILIGYWTRDAIPSLLMPSWTLERFTAEFDTRVLLLAIAVTLVTSVLFSLAPIWQSMHVGINTALKDGGRAMTVAAPLRGRALIVFQVGLSVLLLIGAGLFVRTLSNLRSVTLGFQPERLLLFTMDPPRARYVGHARKVLFDRLQEAIAAIPGVDTASLSGDPLLSGGVSNTSVGVDGKPPSPETVAWVNDVGYHFLETMGIPMLAGRSFDAHDRENTLPVSVVSQQFVREFFPNDNPIGRTFRNNDRLYQIVGIAGDTHVDRARSPVPPTFYRLFTQAGDVGSMTFEVRTAASAAAIMKSVRQAVDAVDKDLPVFDVRTQIDQIDATLSRERLFAMLTASFGALALLLASVGIYGILAHNVTRRTSEIGIRIALGARRGDVLRMILRDASWLAAIGAAGGVAAAVWLGRYVEAMLFGVHPADVTTIAAAIAVMMLVALLAGWLPARRAARLDPMVALRHD
jgi:predicted permease